MFVHFKPTEYDDLLEKFHEEQSKNKNINRPANSVFNSILANAKEALKVTAKKAPKASSQGGHEHDNHDAATIKKHLEMIDREQGDVDGRTILHVAASLGNFEEVEKILSNHNTDMLHARDENGWQPIHEAVRSGNLDIVKYVDIIMN